MEENQANGKTTIQAPVPGPPEQDKKSVNGFKKEVSDEHVQALLAGRSPPRSEMSKYLVERARETSVNGKHVQERLQYARAMINELEVEGQRLAGQMEGYVRDIKHWESKAIDETMPSSTVPVSEPKAKE